MVKRTRRNFLRTAIMAGLCLASPLKAEDNSNNEIKQAIERKLGYVPVNLKVEKRKQVFEDQQREFYIIDFNQSKENVPISIEYQNVPCVIMPAVRNTISKLWDIATKGEAIEIPLFMLDNDKFPVPSNKKNPIAKLLAKEYEEQTRNQTREEFILRESQLREGTYAYEILLKENLLTTGVNAVIPEDMPNSLTEWKERSRRIQRLRLKRLLESGGEYRDLAFAIQNKSRAYNLQGSKEPYWPNGPNGYEVEISGRFDAHFSEDCRNKGKKELADLTREDILIASRRFATKYHPDLLKK